MNSSSVSVLGIHGVHNYQAGLAPVEASARMATWWNDALLKGLASTASDTSAVVVDVAYYAHLLHSGTAQGDDDHCPHTGVELHRRLPAFRYSDLSIAVNATLADGYYSLAGPSRGAP
ncbi:hypothetical protein ABH935_008609 [Catenulispora sp. GAS73]